MIFLFKLLDIILIFLYLKCFIKIKRSEMAFSPIFGFLIGVMFFILFPFSMLTFIEKFTVNPLSGAKGYWSTVDLNDPIFIYPYFVIWISLFVCTLLILLFPMKNVSTKEKIAKFTSNNTFAKIKYLLIMSIVVQCIDWGIVIIEFGGLSNYLGHHWYMRNDLLFNSHGPLYIILTKLFHANKMILTGTSVLFSINLILQEKKKKKKEIFLMFIMILIHLLIVILTGNRIYFAMYLIFTFSSFIMLDYKKPVYIVSLLSPILLFIFSAWSYTRSSLTTNFNDALKNYIQGFEDIRYAMTSMLFDISEGTNILAALHIIKDYGKVFEHLNGLTYFKVIAPLFPDFIDRVDSFTVIAGRNYEPGTNLSLNSTVIAELYANFGLWTILLLPIITFLCIIVGKSINIWYSPIFTLVICTLIFWFVRSVFSDNFISLFLVILILLIEMFFYKILVNISNSGVNQLNNTNSA